MTRTYMHLEEFHICITEILIRCVFSVEMDYIRRRIQAALSEWMSVRDIDLDYLFDLQGAVGLVQWGGQSLTRFDDIKGG